jgi:hypothetical protein
MEGLQEGGLGAVINLSWCSSAQSPINGFMASAAARRIVKIRARDKVRDPDSGKHR